ncbi:UNVERIFIED_CONTAM: hypothetical protein Slati_1127400, partial [Sesamum latifolium]
IAALSRFISKSVEKGLPFFKTLRKVNNFEWTKECQQAFEDLKTYLAKLPLLVKSVPGDTLYLYISSTPQAISLVLVREEEVGVRTNTPLKQVLGKPKTSGRLIKWAIELSEYDILVPAQDNYQGPGLGGLRIRDDMNNPGRSPRSETLATPRRWLVHRTRKWSRHSAHYPSRGRHGIRSKI